jgi:hypothetical protein
MPQVVVDYLIRGGSGIGEFPVVKEVDAQVSYLTVLDEAERDALPEWKLIPLMRVHVSTLNKDFRLGTSIITPVWTEITDVADLNDYQELSEKGQASGYVPLNAETYIDPIYIRSIYSSNAYVVADEAARFALSTVTGDICHQLDTGEVWIKLNNDIPPTDSADWADITTPATVTSVNGKIGAVSIDIVGLLAWANNQSEFNAAVAATPQVSSNTSDIINNGVNISILYQLLADLEDPVAEIPLYSAGVQYAEGNNVIYDPGTGRVNLYRCILAPIGVGTPPDNIVYWERVGDFYTQDELDTALALKADLVDGTVPLSQLPVTELIQMVIVADLTERDALSVLEGQMVIVLDSTGDAKLSNGVLTQYFYSPLHPDADSGGYVWMSPDSDQRYNFNRVIKRIPTLGRVQSGDTITEGLEDMFFGPARPIIAADDIAFAEVGDSVAASISGSVTKQDADTIDAIRYVRVSDETILQTDIPVSPGDDSQTLSFTDSAQTVILDVTETYRVDVLWTKDAVQSLEKGNELPFEGVYPILYGNDATGLADIYTLSKLLVKEGNAYIGVTGTERTYVAIPDTYAALVDIVDQHKDSQIGSLFSLTPAVVSVSSSGLAADWTINYKVYESQYDAIMANERYGYLKTYEDETIATATPVLNNTKLDSIEWGAEVNQTDAEIKTQYEANSDTNAFTNAEQAKLGGIEDNATDDQTGAEIKVAYEGEADTNEFSDAEKAKLAGINPAAIGDMLKSVYDENDDGIVDDSEKVTINVLNSSGGAISKGNILYINSYSVVQGVSSVILADRTLDRKANGIALESIGNGAVGKMLVQGILNGIDTSTYSLNDILYLDTAGLYTNVRPTSGIIQPIGAVSYSDITNGAFYADFGSKIDDETTVPQVITVDPSQGVNIIGDTVSGITDATTTKRYVIELGPGVYTEAPITLKSYVQLQPMSKLGSVRIVASDVNNPLITLASLSIINGLTLDGVTNSFALDIQSPGFYSIEDTVIFNSGSGLQVNHAGAVVDLYGMRLDGAAISRGIYVTAGNVTIGDVQVFGTTTVTDLIEGDGANVLLTLNGITSQSSNVTTGIRLDGSARVVGYNVSLAACNTGISMGDCNFSLVGIQIFNTVSDAIRVEAGSTDSTFAASGLRIEGAGGYNYNVLGTGHKAYGSGISDSTNFNLQPDTKMVAGFVNLIPGDEAFAVAGELHVGSPMFPAESVFGQGDSHVFEHVYTETSGGVFTDHSAAAKSVTGSTFQFDGVDANSAIYIGDALPYVFQGIKVAISVAATMGAGSIVAEYWNGAMAVRA